jgi:hypothetical protein
LLAAGADPASLDRYQRTPLIEAEQRPAKAREAGAVDVAKLEAVIRLFSYAMTDPRIFIFNLLNVRLWLAAVTRNDPLPETPVRTDRAEIQMFVRPAYRRS